MSVNAKGQGHSATLAQSHLDRRLIDISKHISLIRQDQFHLHFIRSLLTMAERIFVGMVQVT